jgi:subtilase family serine protease
LKSQIAKDRAQGADDKRRKNIQRFIPNVCTYLSNVITYMAEREKKNQEKSSSNSSRTTHDSADASSVKPLDPDMIRLASNFQNGSIQMKTLENALIQYIDRMVRIYILFNVVIFGALLIITIFIYIYHHHDYHHYCCRMIKKHWKE